MITHLTILSGHCFQAYGFLSLHFIELYKI